MTLFEALKFNREPLEMLIKLGIKQDDVRYIDLYSEFEAMKDRGEKRLMPFCIWPTSIRCASAKSMT